MFHVSICFMSRPAAQLPGNATGGQCGPVLPSQPQAEGAVGLVGWLASRASFRVYCRGGVEASLDREVARERGEPCSEVDESSRRGLTNCTIRVSPKREICRFLSGIQQSVPVGSA